jgi:hypothetical protein
VKIPVISQGKSIYFNNRRSQVADSFFEHQPDLLGRLTARGLLYECVFVMPSFLHIASTYWKHASGTSPLDHSLVSVSTFFEGVLASPDSFLGGGSSSYYGALSSFQAPGLTPRDLMFVSVYTQEDFSFWTPVHPTRPHRRHVFVSHQRDFVSAASPTRRSGALQTWVPMGPHRPVSWRSLPNGPDLPEVLPTSKWDQRPYPRTW